jgi:hypothetical protein
MSFLVANIPAIEVYIDKRYLYDWQPGPDGKPLGEGEWETGHWVSVKSVPNRSLLFETYIDRFGALYDKLPISAFRWHLNDLSCDYPLGWLQIWDCLSFNISVIEKSVLAGCRTLTTLKDRTQVEGEYLFTVDTCHSEPNAVDAWWSANPAEHKSFNISKIRNGQFVAQPNNRTRWIQPSRGADETQIPYFRYSTRVWRSEHQPLWKPSDTNWDYEETDNQKPKL